MRLGRVAGVATVRDSLPSRHLVTDCQPQRTRSERGEGDEHAGVRQRDDQVVACQGRHTLAQSGGLTERIRHQCQLRPAPGMIGLAIVDPDDDTIAGRQNRSSVGEEPLRRLGGEYGAPVTPVGGTVAVVTPMKSMAYRPPIRSVP